jgi:hypothetical protein
MSVEESAAQFFVYYRKGEANSNKALAWCHGLDKVRVEDVDQVDEWPPWLNGVPIVVDRSDGSVYKGSNCLLLLRHLRESAVASQRDAAEAPAAAAAAAAEVPAAAAAEVPAAVAAEKVGLVPTPQHGVDVASSPPQGPPAGARATVAAFPQFPEGGWNDEPDINSRAPSPAEVMDDSQESSIPMDDDGPSTPAVVVGTNRPGVRAPAAMAAAALAAPSPPAEHAPGANSSDSGSGRARRKAHHSRRVAAPRVVVPSVQMKTRRKN